MKCQHGKNPGSCPKWAEHGDWNNRMLAAAIWEKRAARKARQDAKRAEWAAKP